MKIFFTCAYNGKTQFQKQYDLIVKTIEKFGVELISPEKGNYKELLTKAELASLHSPEEIHYLAIKKGIKWADAVIIETTYPSNQIGYEIALALQNKKKLLALDLKKDMSKRITEPNFFGAVYTKYNLAWIVEDFLNKCKRELHSERFNMFISKSQLDYLEEASNTKGVSKAEYLRLLLEKEKVGSNS